MPSPSSLDALLKEIRECRLCAEHLPRGPRPVLQAGATARILIVGQAPGRRVHESGIPFNDPSGDRLRLWLGMDRKTFYDATRVALVPMGFCYPGTGDSGDFPPRPECAKAWRERVLAEMPRTEITLLVGAYSLAWHLGSGAKSSLTETVRSWREYQPRVWPLPHPSPRNNLWLRRNPWFDAEVLPALRDEVGRVLMGGSSCG